MILAPVLENETERLREVRALNLLDSPREERFDRIVRLAKTVLNVSIAYIALVDRDRQWFKSRCGMSASQTDRDSSFCGHAIASDDTLVIENALEDERFFDNPMVLGEPFIRFYAGRPLKGPNGLRVGTLCIADTRPRRLTQHELQVMDDLAFVVERELQMVSAIEKQQELLVARQELDKVQNRMEKELIEAAAYVADQLPSQISNSTLSINSKYVASSLLGGDMFGYFPLDNDKWVIYLLDVAGHGVGSSLLASTVNHQIIRRSMPGIDYSRPQDVVSALNKNFPMHKHNNKFFTIWYGVYDSFARTLEFTTGGHHPAIFLDGHSSQLSELGMNNLIVGVSGDAEFPSTVLKTDPGTQLFVFSDGVFEVGYDSQNGLGYQRLKNEIQTRFSTSSQPVESIYEFVLDWQGKPEMSDDFSIVHATFH